MVHAGHDFRQHAIAGVEAHYLLEQGGRLLPLDAGHVGRLER